MYNVLALCIALFVVGKASAETICLKDCKTPGDYGEFVCTKTDDPIAQVAAEKCDLAVAYANDLVANVDNELQLLVAATYPNTKTVRYYGVAVVKKNSAINSFADLKGKKSCHTGVGKTSGWVIPVGYLLRKKIMEYETNQYVSVAKFFNGSCAPGIKDKNQSAEVVEDLCKYCKGGCGSDDDYADYEGAFRCLSQGQGDVAFIKETVLTALAKKISDNYRLLCTDGGKKSVDQYSTCYISKRPAAVIVTKGKDDAILKSYRDQILAAVSNFTAIIHEDAKNLTVLDTNAKDYLGDYLLDKQALDGPMPKPTDKTTPSGATNLVVWHLLQAIVIFLAFWEY